MVQWIHWHTEPALLGGILLVTWLYFIAIGPLRATIAPRELFPKREAAWFVAAVISFYVAVGSPLDAVGEGFLFSAHMVQHNLLMYVTALLVIVAIPGWLIDGLLAKSVLLERIFRFLVHPLVAGFCFTFVFCGWHFPALYEGALHNKVLHMIEHLTMLFASVQAFWPIFGKSQRIPRMNCGLQILYVFLLMVVQIPLFGILTFSTELLYPTYGLAPRISVLDPMSDQVLGGLLMKVANMVLSLILMGRAFYTWNEEQ